MTLEDEIRTIVADGFRRRSTVGVEDVAAIMDRRYPEGRADLNAALRTVAEEYGPRHCAPWWNAYVDGLDKFFAEREGV